MMRFTAILLAAALSLSAEQTEYVSLKTDFLRVSGKDAKDTLKNPLKYDASARVMTIYSNILNGTRAETRLRAASSTNETGISFLASLTIRKKNALVNADLNAYYRVPDGGIFHAPDEAGFNDAIGFTLKRPLRVTVPEAAGLHRLPEGGAIVPLLTAYTRDQIPGKTLRASEADIRLICADSSELRRIADFPLEEPMLRDYVLDKIAEFPDSFRLTLKLRPKKTEFQRKTPSQIRIRLTDFADGIYRLTFSETVFIRKGTVSIPETFFYEGYLSARPGWTMPVRIVSAHAGKHSFYEKDPGKTTREKLLMIRFR